MLGMCNYSNYVLISSRETTEECARRRTAPRGMLNARGTASPTRSRCSEASNATEREAEAHPLVLAPGENGLYLPPVVCVLHLGKMIAEKSLSIGWNRRSLRNHMWTEAPLPTRRARSHTRKSPGESFAPTLQSTIKEGVKNARNAVGEALLGFSNDRLKLIPGRWRARWTLIDGGMGGCGESMQSSLTHLLEWILVSRSDYRNWSSLRERKQELL